MNELSTAAEIRSNVNLIQEVMKAVMKEGTHYGIIPGCDKPTLYKAGAEKILSTFRIAADPVVEDLSTPDEARFRVTVKGVSMVSGNFLGSGVGECSSNEEKYKWKKAVCPEEFNETPDDRKRLVWKRNSYKKTVEQVQQIRTNSADVANTILKMAKKRGQIDMTLTATAASDCFIQDIESEEDLENAGERTAQPNTKPATEKPTSKSGDGEPKAGCISKAQGGRFYAIYKGAGKTDEQAKLYLKENFNIDSSRDIKIENYEEICKWAESKEIEFK